MKADFSRLSFDPRKHYAGVLQQQGRVGLDSDWNEWVEMVLHRLTLETRDIIGSCGRPKHAPGFVISADTSVSPPDLLISDGRLYAGGLLAESSSPGHAGTRFSQQTDWPVPSAAVWANLKQSFPNLPDWPGLDPTAVTVQKTGLYQLVYAEVWLRHITALNDEAARDEAYADAGGNPDWTTRPEVGDYIRERALGGPDTCTRLQTVAQVKLWDLDPKLQTCDEACAALAAARPAGTSGTMQLDVAATPPVKSPCQEPLQGGYGGAFNRMYRVEIHDDGAAGTATFKWSNENGAFCLRINGAALSVAAANSNIVITSVGKDQETKLQAGDWVEVCGEETELGVFRNPLAQLAADPVANTGGTWTIQLTGAVIIPHAPFLRRWSANTQTIQLNNSFNLDAGSGLAVTFFDAQGQTAGSTYFHAQDYWTWSARTDIRAVEPQTLANVPQPPEGIKRHYCCLALITWGRTGQQGLGLTANTQCTPIFPPITELTPDECGCCCVLSVGDGVVSQGDYNSLTDAFNNLPDTSSRGGVVICLEEGNHQLDAPVTLTQDRVIIRGCGPATVIHAPAGAFILTGRRQVTFTDLVMESWTAPALAISGCSEITLQDSKIQMVVDRTKTSLAPLTGATLQSAANPAVPALSLQGNGLSIDRNEILGAADHGGIALIPASARVNIRDNFFLHGTLPGVSFGSAQPSLSAGNAAFTSIRIEGNTFREIGAEAILQATPTTYAIPVLVSDLTIDRNEISGCGQTAVIQGASGGGSAIALNMVERLSVTGNRIVNNGGADPAFTGIQITMAGGVMIRQNIISGNGQASTSNSTQSGGGVVVDYVQPEPVSTSQGWPALAADENIISSLNGSALSVGGVGPMRITRNTLANQQVMAQDSTQYCLVVANLGASADAAFLANAGADYFQAGDPTVSLAQFSALTAFGGATQVAENQIVSTISNQTICAVGIISDDDLSFTNNQVTVQSSTVAFSTIFHTLLAIASTLRVIGNRFAEPLKPAIASCYGYGGMVTGALNQSTHCMVFKGTQSEAVTLNLVNPVWSESCAQYAKEASSLAAANQAVNNLRSTAVTRALSTLTAQPAGTYATTISALNDMQVASANLPAPSQDAFILHGRVLNTSGQPQANLSVSLSDPTGILNSRVKPVKTDAQGYFTLTLRTGEFPELKAESQIFVSVTGANGAEVAKPSQPVPYTPGKVAVMPIIG